MLEIGFSFLRRGMSPPRVERFLIFGGVDLYFAEAQRRNGQYDPSRKLSRHGHNTVIITNDERRASSQPKAQENDAKKSHETLRSRRYSLQAEEKRLEPWYFVSGSPRLEAIGPQEPTKWTKIGKSDWFEIGLQKAT
jgi:hypothetical protein